MATLVICEKPSQGRDIARVLGARAQRDGYLEGAGYTVTWGFGHLIEQAPPEHYRPELKGGWRMELLPVVPQSWAMEPKPKSSGQLKTIATLLKTHQDLIIATDADREGELIARELLERFHYRGPIRRLWLSALDDASIRKALGQLKPGRETEALYHAGLGRQRADWLIGMNMTMATSALFSRRGALSVGRVQSPTLRLVVERDRLIEAFQPKTYFQVQARFATVDGREVATTWVVPEEAQGDEEGRCLDRAKAEAVVRKIEGQPGQVSAYGEERKRQPAPLPFSLSALQKKASAMFGMGAARVLQAAQGLYETHKAITYPRTDCGHLPQSQFAEAPQVLAALGRIDPTLAPLLALADPQFRSPAWNDKKVTAHHGIIPTLDARVDLGRMSMDERRLYDLIRRHYIAQFLGHYEYLAIKAEVACEGERFAAGGSRPLVPGWKRAFGREAVAEEEKDDEGQCEIPALRPGEAVTHRASELLEKETTPPPRFTEGSLIEAMKSVGKYVADPQLRKVLRETAGIGTEATRSNILETLFKRGYLERSGKQVISTEKGRALIDLLPPVITDPATTARWEQWLDDVASGSADLGGFLAQQVEVLGGMLEALRAARAAGRDSAAALAGAAAAPAPAAEPGGKSHPCPQCGKPLVRRKSGKGKGFWWGCSGYPECRHTAEDRRGRPVAAKAPATAPTEGGPACPQCGKPMRLREGKNGKFWGCSGYPDCRATRPDVGGTPGPARGPEPSAAGPGIPCPRCGSGQLRRIARKDGGHFWGCSEWRNGCKFTTDDADGAPRLLPTKGPGR